MMTAAIPSTPAGNIEYAESEEEIVTGKKRGKRRPKMLPDEELKQMLREYFTEAEDARKNGTDAREWNWRENHNAYWGRIEDQDKAEWQAAEQMPEVANFVDRHSASLRLALMSQPEWFSIHDPTDDTKQRDRMMREFVKIHLDHCTRNNSGQPVGFDATFAACVKAGAMTVLAASVTFDPQTQFVRVDPVNALELYYDPTGRGLYRIRRRSVDRWQLEKMKKEKDSKGNPLYHKAAINRLQEFIDGEAKTMREEITGSSEESTGGSRRKQVEIDEYLCTIIDRDGKLIRENQLIVFANQREVIRGPEDNPNWHGKDWIVMTPTIDVPFSIWGRSYVEVFRALAATFTEVTNLILDGTFASNVGAHMAWLSALADPSELAEGVYPGIVVTAEEEWPAGKDFIKKIEMGGVSADAFRVWEALKGELREGAGANELSLGQVPPKGDITATEIRGAESGESTLSFALAKDIETKFLAPILELTMMTGLQHFDPDANPILADELNPNMSAMLAEHRQEFANKKYKFVAKGISASMERGKRLQGLMGFLEILGQSEIIAEAFAKDHSIMALVKELLLAFDIQESTLEKTEQEKRNDMQANLAAQNQPPEGEATVPAIPTA
jgi:hypothetical protein